MTEELNKLLGLTVVVGFVIDGVHVGSVMGILKIVGGKYAVVNRNSIGNVTSNVQFTENQVLDILGPTVALGG